MNQFIKEIQEQPEMLERTLGYYHSREGKERLDAVCTLWTTGDYDKIVLTGMGSSYFVSQAAAIMMTAYNIPAFAINAGELLHFQSSVLTERTLLVAISQSGESYEVIELLKQLGERHHSRLTVVGVTNESGSSLAAMATLSLLCKAGREEMTSTKTFITTYLVVYLLAGALDGRRVDNALLDSVVREVGLQLEKGGIYLSRSVAFLSGHPFVQVIGRGTVFASVAQTALMFMEATKTPASALLGGEFRHGPLEMVGPGFICIIYSHSRSGVYRLSIRLVADVLSFNGKVILVSDISSGIESVNLLEINVHCGDPDLFAIPSIVPVQLIVNAWITLINEVKFPTYTKHMEGYLKPIKLTKKVALRAGERKVVELTPEDFPSLLIENPYLWYPNGYGEQYLHHMKLSFSIGGKVSDTKEFDFGIREVASGLNRVGDECGRVYYVNGKRIFCKGGWIQPDILLEESEKRIYDEARLMAEANINLIGSEDMPSPSEIWFESFDKYGLMWWHVFYQCFRMTPGTETADNPLDHGLAVAGVEDMMLRYRNHPSIISWIGANEVLMNESLYKLTKEKVRSIDTTRVYLPTTSFHWDVDALTPYLKEDLPTGTTDDGAPDYNWAPSSYFFDKVREVHLQMFRNELGMPSMPTYNSLRKFIPTAESTANVNSPIFPLDSIWAEHGAWDVSNYCYRSYDNAIRTMFGDPKTAKEYADNAQFLNADGYRAMFEAANHRMWDITSGVMIWKINSCWPDVCWQIYDWYLAPNASYYFAKKAMEPVHVQLNANDFRVSVINASHQTLQDVKVTAKVINNDMEVAWEDSQRITVSPDCYQEIVTVPRCGKYSYNYFVKLELHDKYGKLLSENLYWFYSQHMDFFWFTSMKKPELKEEVEVTQEEGEYVFSICLKNESDRLSHFNHLTLLDVRGKEINPVFWSDNFITLFPGDEKVITARVAVSDVGDTPPVFFRAR